MIVARLITVIHSVLGISRQNSSGTSLVADAFAEFSKSTGLIVETALLGDIVIYFSLLTIIF